MRNKSHVKSIDDALKRFALFYLECQAPNTSARDWHEGSYASILYPNAKMDDRRTDEFLKSVVTRRDSCALRARQRD